MLKDVETTRNCAKFANVNLRRKYKKFLRNLCEENMFLDWIICDWIERNTKREEGESNNYVRIDLLITILFQQKRRDILLKIETQSVFVNELNLNPFVFVLKNDVSPVFV